MEYSDAFESDLEDLEDAAIQLVTKTEDRLEHERRFAAILDHIVNTYPIECEQVVTHTKTVARIWETRTHATTASKHTDTVHQAFLDGICDDYDPVY
ncbi:hypothetical protein ACFQFH_02800 [Halobaculum halobium]|uniref:Uncharacterized protein n=1 Tax=Halobaculum halobium TaxID=3032281 RepID=A0ABD5T601_9EURY|nr:hypothetical protein [Halobaculum sp. SYNS20]